MKTLSGFLFLIPLVALATSRITPQQNLRTSDHCELSAKFLAPKGELITGGPGKASNREHAVFWELEPIDSIGSQCPNTRFLSLRVRAADFAGTASNPKFTYAMDIAEPKPNELVRLKVKFIEGRNTFLNRKFSEWTLIRRIND